MPAERGQILRGALAGTAAAGVWWAQQPLDRRVFGVPYSDVELLGKLVTRGRGWPVAGLLAHLLNGAVFGAAYSAVGPRVPLPAWARGALAGLAEHLATWPFTLLCDRFHPARAELPALFGNPRAFAQATWRHVLFGLTLGELEQRLNPSRGPLPSYQDLVSTNGHGDLEHAAVGSADASYPG